MSQLIHVLNHEIKWLSCTIVFINVGGTSISVKLLPDMCLSYQQAYNWMDNWVNESFAVQ